MNRLEDAARGMESLFIQKIFHEMRESTNPEWDITGASHATQTYQELLDTELSKELSKGQGMGLWKALYNQLSAKETPSPADNLWWEGLSSRRERNESH